MVVSHFKRFTNTDSLLKIRRTSRLDRWYTFLEIVDICNTKNESVV
jgi:hypothetical protein